MELAESFLPAAAAAAAAEEPADEAAAAAAAELPPEAAEAAAAACIGAGTQAVCPGIFLMRVVFRGQPNRYPSDGLIIRTLLQ